MAECMSYGTIQCERRADAYATTFRTQQSEFVTTFVTRNQLDQAVEQAAKMNRMLQQLDKIQAKLL